MSNTVITTQVKTDTAAPVAEKKVETIRTADEIMSEIGNSNPEAKSPINMPQGDAKTKALARIVDTGIIDMSRLSEKDKKEIVAIGKKLNVHDMGTVTNYGSELQRAMNDSSRRVLASSRASKVGDETQMILRDMMDQIKEIDIDEIHAPSKIERILRKIPILKKIVNSVEKFMAKYDNLETTVEKCEDNLRTVNLKAKSDNTELEKQFQETSKYITVLEKFIIAGKNKSNELQVVIDKMEANAANYDAIQINDIKTFKHDLDLRLTNMLTWRTTFMQSLIRIREIQNANMALSNNVSDTVDNMMPMLRHQLAEAVSLYNLQQGIKVVDTIQKGFNDILAHNADMTHDAVIAVHEQTENTVVRMETLRHNQERLIATMRDAQRICEQGAAKRKAQEKELAKMNNDMAQLVSGTTKIVEENAIESADEIEAKYIGSADE